MKQAPWVDRIFDTTPRPFSRGPVDPLIYDASAAARRQRTVNFAAKRYADMMFVTGLDRTTADRHFRWRIAPVPGGLDEQPGSYDLQTEGRAAFEFGRISIATDPADCRAVVRWDDPALGAPVIGQALTRPGYGSILLGAAGAPAFDPAPVARSYPNAGLSWPTGDAVDSPASAPSALESAVEAYFTGSPGTYGVLIARPDRVLFERYSDFGAPDRATPSWSMTKAITCTVIGRLMQEGWLSGMHDPAPAPLWADPRAIHRLITLDHLVRMRSGLGMPVLDHDGRTYAGYENSAVYQDAADAFETAQRSIVTTLPGSTYRYVNSGMNVLGAITRDQIERRGLPYYQTAYGLLVDRLGMRSYQHSADIAGNLIASGAGYATLRDYAKLGVLYLNDGVWNGERLLPEGWADYALTATHTGTSYAACFRTNIDGSFPDLPADAAWASGASDQRIFVLRRQRLTVAVANETDHPISAPALSRMVAAAIAAYA
jgi:CubicO group peptidase (beta-lactamase class C family)